MLHTLYIGGKHEDQIGAFRAYQIRDRKGIYPVWQGVLVEAYETGNFNNSEHVKDVQLRFCFDMSYIAGLDSFVCDILYKYLNDSNYYTALKRVCPKVTRKY